MASVRERLWMSESSARKRSMMMGWGWFDTAREVRLLRFERSDEMAWVGELAFNALLTGLALSAPSHNRLYIALRCAGQSTDST